MHRRITRLVKINNTDITANIVADSYDINLDTSDYESWEDADHKEHRDYITKIKGSFDLKFTTGDQYSAFVNLIKAAHNNERVLPLSVYCVNINEQRSLSAFYKFEPKLTKSLPGGKQIGKFKFEIKEQ